MNCPHCQSHIEVVEKNYGALFTCPSCQAVYFINFEGQPEYSPETAPTQEPQETQETHDISAQFEPFLNHPEISQPHTDSDSEFSRVAQEITNFGNSDLQISTLSYNLQIKGLDSKEELSEFKDSINDIRFGWDVSELMKKIKNGELSLEKLNPVQAFILNRRIRFLNLELKWKQNALE